MEKDIIKGYIDRMNKEVKNIKRLEIELEEAQRRLNSIKDFIGIELNIPTKPKPDKINNHSEWYWDKGYWWCTDYD